MSGDSKADTVYLFCGEKKNKVVLCTVRTRWSNAAVGNENESFHADPGGSDRVTVTRFRRRAALLRCRHPLCVRMLSFSALKKRCLSLSGKGGVGFDSHRASTAFQAQRSTWRFNYSAAHFAATESDFVCMEQEEEELDKSHKRDERSAFWAQAKRTGWLGVNFVFCSCRNWLHLLSSGASRDAIIHVPAPTFPLKSEASAKASQGRRCKQIIFFFSAYATGASPTTSTEA